MRKLFQIALTVLVIVIISMLIWSTWIFFAKTLSLVTKVDNQIAISIITGIGAIIVAIVSITITKLYEKRQLIEQEIRNNKIKCYEIFIDFLFDTLLNKDKMNKPSTEVEMQKFFNRFTKTLVFWGSDEVLKEWSSFRAYLVKNSDNVNKSEKDTLHFVLKLEKLLKMIRKDTGHKNIGIKEGDIIQMFINDLSPERISVIKKSKSTHM